jgi:hypothetical protein
VPGEALLSLNAEPLLLGGYEQEPSGTLRKTLAAGSGAARAETEPGRAGEKGSKELLTAVDTRGRHIAVLPRAYVEKFNLLIPAIGVLVHNQLGQIYVHQVRVGAEGSWHQLARIFSCLPTTVYITCR